MSIRRVPDDPRVEENLSVDHLSTREEIREYILAKWVEEAPMQKYRYFVADFEDGSRGYLERPARLNKGCDFVIYIEDLILYKNGNDKPPSHQDLANDLQTVCNSVSQKCWNHLISSIAAIHGLNSYEIPPNCQVKINELPIMGIEKIHFLCKWLFIEQDITYWSGQGRDMLWNGIANIQKQHP